MLTYQKSLVFIILVVLISSFSFAQTSQDESGGVDGSPRWDYVKQQLSFWDRFVSDKTNKQTLTVVNGALCSSTASWSTQSKINADTSCWNNINGGSPGGTGIAHIGVA